MPLVKAQCTNCGAALEVDDTKEAAVCPYCNTPYIVEKAINNYTTNITNNINAQVVNIINQKEDYEIVAGTLVKYNGKSADIVIPDEVIKIEKGAIPKSVKSIVFGNGITKIEESILYDCKELVSVTIPNTVTSIGGYAFHGCDNLYIIRYQGTIKQWCEIFRIVELMNYGKTYKQLYINGEEIAGELVIPNDVTKIGSNAFIGCTGLTKIEIPNSVTTIGFRAFVNCIGLISITIPDSITSIGDNAFGRCNNAIVYTNNPYAIKYCETNGIKHSSV